MSRALGTTLVGVEGAIVEVEVRISSLLPRVDIVGLPEAAVRESSARVRAAISSTGQRFPDRRVTVNLAPAELRKSGAALDLAIAVGILGAAGALEHDALTGRAFLGELALDGRLRPVRGALALVLAARDAGCRQVIVPEANAREGALAPEVEVVGARDLGSVCAHLVGAQPLTPAVAERPSAAPPGGPDLSDVRGQESGRRALEIAAAGHHGLLLSGPPGSGKTMLSRRLPGLLPPMSFEEALEAARIHGVAGAKAESAALLRSRPFRAPHHSATTAGLIGGGNPPRPGEISLAHKGVLFLDELPEFERRALEALREVLESRSIRIARASYLCVFPADFLFVAACNPCPCGWHGSARHDCRCDDATLARYRRRLSGPLIDRIDLQVAVDAVPWKDLDRGGSSEPSAPVRERVQAARARQRARGVETNARIPDARLDALVAATPAARRLLGEAVDGLALSARAARRVLRVARTIADLTETEAVTPQAIADALQFRDRSPT